MRYSTWPARTSLPSRNRRSSTMPAARARTCATREASRRPGSSVTMPTSPAATRTTPTSGGGMPPPAACGAPPLPWPQAASASTRGDRKDQAGTCDRRAAMGVVVRSRDGKRPRDGGPAQAASIYMQGCMYIRGAMARRSKEDALATRTALLDAAERVFLAQGVAGTSLNDIAVAAGTTRGAIYWHFRDKADLFNAMMDRVTLPLQGALTQVEHDAAQDPLPALRAAVQSAFRQTVRDPQTRRVFEVATHK